MCICPLTFFSDVFRALSKHRAHNFPTAISSKWKTFLLPICTSFMLGVSQARACIIRTMRTIVVHDDRLPRLSCKRKKRLKGDYRMFEQALKSSPTPYFIHPGGCNEKDSFIAVVLLSTRTHLHILPFNSSNSIHFATNSRNFHNKPTNHCK